MRVSDATAIECPAPLRTLFVSPAYHPATAFGGPIWMARELNERLLQRGHTVQVLTTSLLDIKSGRTLRDRLDTVGGVPVRYLATPVQYRWMGVCPGVVRALDRLDRPDIVHIFGLRDPIGTLAALWCRRRGVPYVLEPLGMAKPRVRKMALKRVLDATLYRPVIDGASLVVATSDHERSEMIECGWEPARIAVRANGFPDPAEIPPSTGRLRRLTGAEGPLVLYVGRIAAGKGIELLLGAARRLPGVAFALIGPEDGHGVGAMIEREIADTALSGRVHWLPPESRPLDLYADADVFVLPSEGESFGMAAAEAAAAGVPIVITDRCGVAEFLDGAAMVIPCSEPAVTEALGRVLEDETLRLRLAAAGPVAARRQSWEEVARRQDAIYREAIERSRAVRKIPDVYRDVVDATTDAATPG